MMKVFKVVLISIIILTVVETKKSKKKSEHKFTYYPSKDVKGKSPRL